MVPAILRSRSLQDNPEDLQEEVTATRLALLAMRTTAAIEQEVLDTLQRVWPSKRLCLPLLRVAVTCSSY